MDHSLILHATHLGDIRLGRIMPKAETSRLFHFECSVVQIYDCSQSLVTLYKKSNYMTKGAKMVSRRRGPAKYNVGWRRVVRNFSPSYVLGHGDFFRS
jgi:hypothetical protein